MIRHATTLIERLVRSVAERWSEPTAIEHVQVIPAWRKGIIRVSITSPAAKWGDAEVSVHEGLLDDLSSNGPIAQDLLYRVSEVARLTARARSISSNDGDAPPAWSVTLPRLFQDVLAQGGLDAQAVIDGMGGYSGYEGIALPQTPGVDLSMVTIQNGRLLGWLALEGGSHRVHVRSCDDEDGACAVVIHDMDLPETAMALDEVPLDEVLQHPDISAGGGHVVHYMRRRTENGSTDIHLIMKPDPVWGAVPPSEADVAWRDMREGKRLRIA